MTTVPVVLDDRHLGVLDELAKEQEMTRSALMRQALRLYQMVHDRAKKGQTLAFRNADGGFTPVVIVGLPDLSD